MDFGILISYLILAAGAVGGIYVVLRRRKLLKKARLFRSLDLVFLEITVPRESSEDKFGQESTKQNEKELIGIAEQLFTTLSFPEKSFWHTFWYGRDNLSFEIAAFGKKIHFYITCPRRVASVVERQVHAQYPKAVVEEVSPYKIFSKTGSVSAAELKLQKGSIYPIKTYLEQNSDPLNALTNAMSKLTEGESMAMQLVLSPAKEGWDSYPRHLAQEIQKGKHPQDVDLGAFGKIAKEVGATVKMGATQFVSGSTKAGDERNLNLTPMQQETVKKLEEKASKTGFYANIRIIAVSDNRQLAESHITALLSAFTQYTLAPFNGFMVESRHAAKISKNYILRNFKKTKTLLNAAELTSLWHPPTRFTETPNISWLGSRKAPPPVNAPESGVLLGISEYRGVETLIRIMDEDRLRHVYVLGRTGTGKTEIMKNMVAQDIASGRGVCVVDPHGEFIEDVLTVIPKDRVEDVILFDPADMNRPVGLNMLDIRDESQRDMAAAEMIAIFYKLFPPEYLGPMFEHNMRNVLLTLMADPADPGTIAEVPRMFTDPEFQKKYVSKVADPTVRAFWEKEVAKTSDFHKSEMMGYLVSKVGRFVENTMMRNIIGQQRNSFDFREIMDGGKIFLVNLSKGKIGEINAKLLGLIIVSKLQMAALSRADVPESERRDFYLYVDEFQNFVTDSFATILSEARKYHLSLTVAHQYLSQLTTEKPGSSAQDTSVRDAVFGNVGTMVVFRIGVEDAEVIAREMAPTFSEFDVVNIERFHAYVKLMIHNTVSRPFSMRTLPLQKLNEKDVVAAIKELAKLKYGRPRAEVEGAILQRSQLEKIPLEPKDPGLRLA